MAVHHPNRRQWQRGDLVIHDRDAKEHRLIRVVVARLPGGLLQSVYAFRKELPDNWSARHKVFTDRPEYLLDPKRFRLTTKPRRRAA